jgi:RNA polymerase sigma factor (sigma-70 family)
MKSNRRSLVATVMLGAALSAYAPAAQAEPSAIADISRYCTACWRNARLPADCWTDCTQDVFLRLLERVTPADWDKLLADGDQNREFLRAIDAVKKRTQRARKYGELVVEPTAPAAADGHERMLVEQTAAELLSERQQRVLRLSFAGWSVQEMADELGIGPERVSDEKYKAIRKLRERLMQDELD